MHINPPPAFQSSCVCCQNKHQNTGGQLGLQLGKISKQTKQRGNKFNRRKRKLQKAWNKHPLRQREEITWDARTRKCTQKFQDAMEDRHAVCRQGSLPEGRVKSPPCGKRAKVEEDEGISRINRCSGGKVERNMNVHAEKSRSMRKTQTKVHQY